MMIRRIERADMIPLILYWLTHMKVDEIIDNIYKAHTNRDGLTYGRLAVLFITYVIHSLNHRLSGMEEWLKDHKTVIGQVTGRKLKDNDATDDRLGKMIGVFGEDDSKDAEFQERMGQQIITAYELPTDIARYDTTSFNVYHQSDSNDKGLLRFGHSKDHRPDLLQYEQGARNDRPFRDSADDRYHIRRKSG